MVLPAFGDFFLNAAPAQLKANLIVRRKMMHFSNAGNNAVLFLKRLQIAVIKDRSHFHVVIGNRAFERAKSLQNKHPAAGQRILRIHPDRVSFQQPAEIPCPEFGAVKSGMFRVVIFDFQMKILRGQNASVIVLIHIGMISTQLFLRLLLFLRPQMIDSLLVGQHCFFYPPF